MASTYFKAATDSIRRHIEAAHGPLPPGFLVQFLLEDWRRYLAMVHRDHGEHSAEWREANRLTERLLWSIAPKETPEERAELVRSLEPLLSGLRRGMEVSGMDDERRAEFLRLLESVHIVRINPPATQPGGAATDTSPGDETITLDIRDPRYRQLLDLLQGCDLEHVEM